MLTWWLLTSRVMAYNCHTKFPEIAFVQNVDVHVVCVSVCECM